MAVRKLTRSDITAMLAIENSVHVAPWTKETFDVCLEADCPGWVSEQDGKGVVGFIIVSNQANECHILNIGVSRPCQHQGFGRELLDEALTSCQQDGAGIAYLEVRRTNSRAIRIYEAAGFVQIGERENYYPGGEDALVYAKLLTSS